MKNSTRYRVIEVLRLFSGSVLPIIFWISVIFGFDAPYVAILTIVSAVFHEIGHYLAIILVGCRGSLRGHSTGFRITVDGDDLHRKSISVLLAGPMANMVLFLIALPFGNALNGYVSRLGFISLATGVSNLLPLEGYDGYGALCEVFTRRDRYDLIRRLESFSFFFSVSITFLSLYLIDRFSEGYWIFGLFFIMTLSKLCYFGKYDIFGE